VRSGRPHASLAVLALAFACPSTALAGSFHRDQTPLSPAVTGAAGGGSGNAHVSAGGSFARMVVGLAIVIAVIYGVYWLLKAYGRSKGGLSDDGRMSVLATTALGPNRAVHLVRVGDELVLVGSAEGGVTPIRVYSADDVRRLELESGGPLVALGRAGGTGRRNLIEELRKRTAR
jgi:flagellar protein FliO/FliZ